MKQGERLDLRVETETGGLIITSKSRWLGSHGGQCCDWRQAHEAGVMVPVSTSAMAPGSLDIVRIVLDELSAEEEANCLSRAVARLRVPCGLLALAHGAEAGEDPQSYVDEETGRFTREYPALIDFVEVPAADYRLDIYTVASANNIDVFGECGDEPVGEYFRRTRQGESFPEWLVYACAHEQALDPGRTHTSRFEDYDELMAAEPMVDLIIQLRPDRGGYRSTPLGADGWIAYDAQPRLPARAPRGLAAAPVSSQLRPIVDPSSGFSPYSIEDETSG